MPLWVDMILYLREECAAFASEVNDDDVICPPSPPNLGEQWTLSVS